ncbi:hypothetical protein [Pseudomonas sp. NPDC086251]|uniref:hypothetical protein n=1 Tax=Pseudomonas sp. NPDC086251 TaxID=3364431 RepID=UPI0038394297
MAPANDACAASLAGKTENAMDNRARIVIMLKLLNKSQLILDATAEELSTWESGLRRRRRE